MQKYTKQQIIEYLQNKIDAGEIISTSSFKSGMIKLDTIYKYLGCKNWTEVLEIIDRKDSIKFRKFLSKEEIEKEINTFIISYLYEYVNTFFKYFFIFFNYR